MSTDHQKYSTENQKDAIAAYAARHNLTIVRTYEDAGRSGLRIEGRDALKQLIEDVRKRRADYSVLVVYDVSRWGRFLTRTKAPTTSTPARRQASGFSIAPSSSKTTVACRPPSSRA
ncbi:recombinase family protein [Bradyrhizobium sp. LLZ17]|uniref:Recombinase family protein n=1 Tax=Bradyrhizobium sp. LLZ17 TaxID=3239388 RepID=A0AB39XCL0_9BRAD